MGVGVVLKPLIEKLNLQSSCSENISQNNHIRDLFENFENKYLYRFFVHTHHEQDSEVEELDINS